MPPRRGVESPVRWTPGSGNSAGSQDTDEAILGDGAGRPAVLDLLLEPPSALLVQNVITIEQGQKDVDVQQCAQVPLGAG